MPENEEKEISKFNEANLQIQRLNNLWVKAEFYANTNRMDRWKYILESIWRELYPDVLRLSDREKILKRNKLSRIKVAKNMKSSGIYLALSERHEFLKEIQDAAGKGGIYESVHEDEFD